MEQKTIGDVTSLASAVNRLLEHVGPHTQKTCASNVHKTVSNLLFSINDLLSADVTAQIASQVAQPAAVVVAPPVDLPADGSIRLSPQQILEMNIGVLGLPMRLEIPLQKASFRKIRDLCSAPLEALREVDGVGSAGLDTMMEALEQFGISLTE